MTDYNLKSSTYPTGGTMLLESGVKMTKSSYNTTINNVFYCKDNDTNNFSLTAQSKSNNAYTVGSKSTTVTQYTGTFNADAACNASGFTNYTKAVGHTSGGWTFWVT